MDEEWETLRHRVIEAIDGVLRGTDWGPPADRGSILTDVVVLTGWVNADGSYATSVLKTSSPWAAEGLIHDAYQREVEGDRIQKRHAESEDDD